MLLAEFSLTPIGKGTSVSAWVSRSLDIIDRAGVPYRLGPMGTCVEGEWDEVFAAIRRCHEVVHQMGAPRISCVIKTGTRTDRTQSMDDKVRSVREKM